MSAVATGTVWARSGATGSTLLVLLAVADAANQECANSWQSVATIGRMARVSEATVHRALKDLLDTGELVHTGDHPEYGTRVYRLGPALTEGGLNMTPPREEGGVKNGPEGVSPVTPKPTTNPTTTPTTVSSLPHTDPEPTPREGKGQMTRSWRPTPGTKQTVQGSCPALNYPREASAFIDWHIGQGTAAKTQTQWDALFRAWCARKQEEWEKGQPRERAFDETSGMPTHPREPIYADQKERER